MSLITDFRGIDLNSISGQVPFGNLKKIGKGANVSYTNPIDKSVTNIYYPTATEGGSVVVQTKKENSINTSQSSESGFGGTSPIATGEGATATQENGTSKLLQYGLIGGLILATFYVVKK